MVWLTALHQAGRQSIEELDCPVFNDKPFVSTKALRQANIALVSTAGLIERGDAPFRGGDAGYRAIPASVNNADVLISHISTNFDRSAAVMNIESIFPRQLLTDMVSDGEVGSAAQTHYSFMGATDPMLMEAGATQLARSLLDEGIDTAVFLPV